jgi:transposase
MQFSTRRFSLVIPENIELIFFPRYSPELNPAEKDRLVVLKNV